ncbi:cation:proton antiporter [Paractinoplanes toevensis]|uniref:Cation/H+ exchanger transmembrane domain-containing protein n=1 Tax=Paractinoplanes toevensis TaxID=571911 RepID=A0A919TEB5_9ACTN|nr:cation:proton antiporter [Actinoplanes toevensis]GIM92594.1 hypothetical protein Ato02nite_043870 [Actinoplanes toevensis]
MIISAVHPPVGLLAPESALNLLLQVAVLLALALVLGRLAVRAGLPAIVGELCAGVVAGPSVLGHLAPALWNRLFPQVSEQFHLLDAIGQVGVILLVGLTGMEMDLGLVLRRGTTALRIGGFGLIVPLGLGVALGLVLPAALRGTHVDRWSFVLFMGVTMCVSAIPVIAKTLGEMGLTHRNVGQLTLAASTIDDIVGWLLLSIVSAMVTAGISGGALALTLARPWLLIAGAVLVVPLLARLVRRFDRRPGDVVPTTTGVVTILVATAAAAQALKLEAVFGAFVAGILIGTFGRIDPRRLAPLRTVVMAVLAPLFFATAGLRMDVASLATLPVALAGLAVLLVAIAGKLGGVYAGARLSRLSPAESLAIGAGLNARGVIEIIVALTGLRLGVLTPAAYTIVVLVAIATSVMAPPLLRVTMRHVDESAEEVLRAQNRGITDPAMRS